MHSSFATEHETSFVHATHQITVGAPDQTSQLTLEASGLASTKVNETAVTKAVLSRHFPVVAIQPMDSELILGPSQGRREFVHRIAFSAHAEFLSLLRSYEAACVQRNGLLRDTQISTRDLYRSLALWDETFCQSAAALQTAITRAFTLLQRGSADLLAQFLGSDQVTLDEVPGFETEATVEQRQQPDFWQKLLTNWIEKDRRNGYTSVGPHRWDWEARFEGIPAKVGASFGQVRAMTIALRLAAAESMERALAQKPLVLLDDLNSEIDGERRVLLLQALADRKYQTWITTTDPRQVTVPGGVSVVSWLVAKQSLQRHF